MSSEIHHLCTSHSGDCPFLHPSRIRSGFSSPLLPPSPALGYFLAQVPSFPAYVPVVCAGTWCEVSTGSRTRGTRDFIHPYRCTLAASYPSPSPPENARIPAITFPCRGSLGQPEDALAGIARLSFPKQEDPFQHKHRLAGVNWI